MIKTFFRTFFLCFAALIAFGLFLGYIGACMFLVQQTGAWGQAQEWSKVWVIALQAFEVIVAFSTFFGVLSVVEKVYMDW